MSAKIFRLFCVIFTLVSAFAGVFYFMSVAFPNGGPEWIIFLCGFSATIVILNGVSHDTK